MIQDITIQGIQHSNTNKNGVEYEDEKGKKTRVVITAQNLPNNKKDTSSFVYKNSPVLNWKVGETHQVDITPSKDGKYLNFFPTKAEIYPNPNMPARPAVQVETSRPAQVNSTPATGLSNKEIMDKMTDIAKDIQAIKIYIGAGRPPEEEIPY